MVRATRLGILIDQHRVLGTQIGLIDTTTPPQTLFLHLELSLLLLSLVPPPLQKKLDLTNSIQHSFPKM